jgi:hypothetical protein
MRGYRFPSLVLLSLAGPLALAQAGGRVPANGSFEQLDAATGQPAGWIIYNPVHNLCSYTLTMAHDGVAAVSVVDDDPVASQGLRSPRTPIVAGKTYQATGYVWIKDVQVGGFAIYLEFWQGDQRVFDKSVAASKVGEWVELKVEGTAPAGAKDATMLIYGGSTTIGHAYFDDLTLTEMP